MIWLYKLKSNTTSLIPHHSNKRFLFALISVLLLCAYIFWINIPTPKPYSIKSFSLVTMLLFLMLYGFVYSYNTFKKIILLSIALVTIGLSAQNPKQDGNDEKTLKLEISDTKLPGEKEFRAQFEGRSEADQKLMEKVIQNLYQIQNHISTVQVAIDAGDRELADQLHEEYEQRTRPNIKNLLALKKAGYDVIGFGMQFKKNTSNQLKTIKQWQQQALNDKIALTIQEKEKEIVALNQKLANEKKINQRLEESIANLEEINQVLKLLKQHYNKDVTKKQLQTTLEKEWLKKTFIKVLSELPENIQNDFQDLKILLSDKRF